MLYPYFKRSCLIIIKKDEHTEHKTLNKEIPLSQKKTSVNLHVSPMIQDKQGVLKIWILRMAHPVPMKIQTTYV